MAKQRVRFTFPEERVQDPIIYLLGRDYNIVTNIRRAEIADTHGWVVLEIEGSAEEIQKGLAWVKSRGVRVDPVVGDIVAG